MKRIVFLLLPMVILFLSCNDKQIGIVQVSTSLSIRENPNPNAKIIDKLPNGSLIYILNKYPTVAYSIKGVTGKYCYVEYNTNDKKPKHGYAFDAYIKRQANIPLIALSILMLLIFSSIATFLVINKRLRNTFYNVIILKIAKIIKQFSVRIKNNNSLPKAEINKDLNDVPKKGNTAHTPKRLIVFLISIVIIIVILIPIVKSPIVVNTVIKYFYPPEPIIVSGEADDLNSSLFDYKQQLYVEIRNDGGDGYILLEVTLTQDNNSWTKSNTAFFNSRETKTMSIEFNEVKLLGKNSKITYRVSSYSK